MSESDADAGESWQKTRQRVLARDAYECRFCGMSREEHRDTYDRDLHVHHIVPENPAGDDADDNLLTVCMSCHRTIESLHARKLVERYALDTPADALVTMGLKIEEMREWGDNALHETKKSGWTPELDEFGDVPIWVTDNMSRHERACYDLGRYEALKIWANEIEASIDAGTE